MLNFVQYLEWVWFIAIVFNLRQSFANLKTNKLVDYVSQESPTVVSDQEKVSPITAYWSTMDLVINNTLI